MYYNGEEYLNGYIETIMDEYISDFIDYWGFESEEPPQHVDYTIWEWYKLWNEVADELIAAAKKLHWTKSVVFPGLDLNDLREILDLAKDEGALRQFVEQRIEIGLSQETRLELETRRKNMMVLLTYLVRPVSDIARAYLSRTSECFLRGLHAETIVMCGSALEAALEDLTDHVEDQRGALQAHQKDHSGVDATRVLDRNGGSFEDAWRKGRTGFGSTEQCRSFAA